MQVRLHTTDSVVVHNKASAASFLEDVEYLLAVAEAIEERGQSTKVHCETRVEQQVRVYALQFVQAREAANAGRVIDAETLREVNK